MEIKPINELDGNRVELVYENKLSKKTSVISHFSVPKDKADEFSASFKKQRKNNTIFSLIGTGLSALLGVYLGGKVAKLKTYDKPTAAIDLMPTILKKEFGISLRESTGKIHDGWFNADLCRDL